MARVPAALLTGVLAATGPAEDELALPVPIYIGAYNTGSF
jgi:hypothetical protein